MAIQDAEKVTVYPLKVEDASKLATHFGLPVPIVNSFFCLFNDTLYCKAPFRLYQAHKKGCNIVPSGIRKEGETIIAKVVLYPIIPTSRLKELLELRKANATVADRILEQESRPIEAEGKASPSTVRMKTMQPFLDRIALKRAYGLACQLYAGYGSPALYEDLPQVVLSKKELEMPEAESVGSDVAEIATPTSEPKNQPLPGYDPKTKPIETMPLSAEKLSEDEAKEIRPMVQSNEILRWITKKTGGGTRLLQPDDPEGYTNAKNEDGSYKDPAAVIVSFLEEHHGSFSVDGEIIYEDKSQPDKIFRKKAGTL